MPITKKQASEFLKEIAKITHKQQLVINDFDKRMSTLYDQKKSIQALIMGLNLLKKEDRIGGRKQLLYEIQHMKHDLITEFALIIEGAVKDRDLELALVKREHDKYDERVDAIFNQFETLHEAHKKGGAKKTDAQQKCCKMLEHINEELKQEKKSVITEMKNITKNMSKIMKAQSKIVLYEINVLNTIEDMLTSHMPLSAKAVDVTIKKLREAIKKLMYILQTEKESIIDPFNHFLKEKRTVMRKVKKTGRKRTITFDDISRDIETLTKPSELRIYLSGLNKYARRITKDAKDILDLATNMEDILHYHKKHRLKFQKTI